MWLAMNATCVHPLRHAMVAVVRMREDPFRTVGKEGQAFSVIPAFTPALPKKPAPSLL
jgi:hypothetical protein